MSDARGLAIDILAYQVQGRIRSTLLSSRAVITPANGVISKVEKLMNASETLNFVPPSVASGFVLRSSAPVNVAVTLQRTPSNVVIEPVCNSFLALTDNIVSVAITNPSSTSQVDVSVVSI